MTESTQLWVNRIALRTTCIGDQKLTCKQGDVLLVVERFALTANNISYALAGETADYWQFFPAPRPWGNVPVWGYAKVIKSLKKDVKEGERFYGFLPMATHLIVRPEKVEDDGFTDGSKYRTDLPATYNRYRHMAAAVRNEENAYALLRPLFVTSFVLDDFLANNDFFNSRSIIISSASSKTSIGLAFELGRRHKGAVEIVGLTSPGHSKFVEGLGLYNQVLSYDFLESLDAVVPSLYVDVAGDFAVQRRVHEHFNQHLVYSCKAGATHWEQFRPSTQILPGPKPTQFFAPAYIIKRNKSLGSGEFARQIDRDWEAFVVDTDRWLKIVEVQGTEAMQRSYLEMLEGHISPDRGIIILPAGKSIA